MGRRRLSVTRLAFTGIIVMVILYAACWVAAAFFGLPATHHLLDLFTDSDPTSTAGLSQGLVRALIFGGVTGALVAIVYNLLGFVDDIAVRPQRTSE